MESIINKLVDSNLYSYKNNIYIQNIDTISMYDINKKEKEAMDKVVHSSCNRSQNTLEDFYNTYSEKKIVEQNLKKLKELEFKEGSVAIDCGCGQGDYLRELSTKFSLVIAIDLSLEAIIYARNINMDLDNIIYINGSMLDFYKVFNESIANFCLSAEVIEHVPSPHAYLENIYNLLKEDGILLISTPCQNLYFYPVQFISMLLTKPKTLLKLLNPLENWEFSLDWHPAMSKKTFLNLLGQYNFEKSYYKNFVPYYFDKFPIIYYIAKILPNKYSLPFYKLFLSTYNSLIEKISFGIRQHALVRKK